MRLEVLVGNEDPLIFPLNKPKIIIGSSESCDVVLTDGNVSRKHIFVLVEGDNFFVIDQGSTNGSYINEERLVPGRRVEFTSFFPVRLGDNVLLTLLSDEEVGDQSLSSFSIPIPLMETPRSTNFDDATRVLSLKDLKAASTSQLTQKKRKAATAKTAPKKKPSVTKDNSRMLFVKVIAFCLLGGAVYYNSVLVKNKSADESVQNKVEKVKRPVPVVRAPVHKVVEDADLLSKDKLIGMMNDFKCTLDTELKLCNNIQGADKLPWGVLQFGSNLIIMVPAKIYADEAKKFFKDLPADAEIPPETRKQIDYITHLVFIKRALPKELSFAAFDEYKIFFALFESPTEIRTTSAFMPESLVKLRELLTDERVNTAKYAGADRLNFLKFFFKFY